MQINRLFEMIYMLLDKKCITAREFAEHFEISKRTVYRDVDTLSTAGIPIFMQKGKGGGISLLPNFILNKTVLTKHEKEEILSSLHALKSLTPAETDTTLQKMSSILGDANADWIEVDFSDWNHRGREFQNFNLIKPAVIHKKIIEITYSSNKEEKIRREVLPLKLCFKSQAWYLYAYCRLRKDLRFFKLKRIKEIQVLQETFNMDVPKKLFNEELVYLDRNLIDLKLRIAPYMSYRVMDEFEDYDVDQEGYYICRWTVPDGEWLFGYLASYGNSCQILQPNELKIKLRDKLQAWLASL